MSDMVANALVSSRLDYCNSLLRICEFGDLSHGYPIPELLPYIP